MCTWHVEGAGAGWVCLYIYAMCIGRLIKTHCFKHPCDLADTRQQHLPADRQLLLTVETTHPAAQQHRGFQTNPLAVFFPDSFPVPSVPS